jgi:hypothetical protein
MIFALASSQEFLGLLGANNDTQLYPTIEPRLYEAFTIQLRNTGEHSANRFSPPGEKPHRNFAASSDDGETPRRFRW